MVLLTALLFVVATLDLVGSVTLRPKRVLHLAAAAGDGVHGRVRGAGPDPVLPVLGARAAPDVPADLHLGHRAREYSAIKFVLYTLAGSALMLVGFLVARLRATGHLRYADARSADITQLPRSRCSVVFLLILVAFAVKLPVFPLHTWLPDAHTDAPTAVSRHPGRRAAEDGRLRDDPDPRRHPAGPVPRLRRRTWRRWRRSACIYGAVPDAAPEGPQAARGVLRRVSHMGYVLLGVAALGR